MRYLLVIIVFQKQIILISAPKVKTFLKYDNTNQLNT